MKKLLFFTVFLVIAVSMLFMGISCKSEEAPSEETVVEEEPMVEEETVAEEEVSEEEEMVLEDTLNIFSWGYYIDYALEPFEKEYGVKVNIEYFDNIPDQMNKLKTVGEGTYDISFMGVESYQKFNDLSLVEPLDTGRLENWDNIYQGLKNLVYEYSEKIFSEEEKIGAIPYAWGTTGIIYNNEEITEPIDSWAAMWDEKYAGRIAILDSIEEDQRYTALYLGLDINDFSDEAIEKIVAAWKEQKPLIKTYWATGEDLIQFFTIEEVWLANGWDGQARSMITDGYPISYVIPMEGAVAWVDGPFMVKGAPHPNLAYKFIDWLTNADIQLKMTEEIMYSPSNSKVKGMIDDETAAFLAIDNEDRIMGLIIQDPWDVETTQKLTELWNEVKS